MFYDFHIHATAYRLETPAPDHTVKPLLQHARKKGYHMIGLLEHLNAAPIHPLDCIRQLVADFRECDMPMPGFVGVEADILNRDGTVSCDTSLQQELGLDYIIASVHLTPSHCERLQDYIEEEFQRIIGCLQHASVDIIGHPWGQGRRWQNSGSVQDWSFSLVPAEMRQEIIRLSVDTGKALELNLNHTAFQDDPVYWEFINDFGRSGGRIATGSDAHRMNRIPGVAQLETLLSKLDPCARLNLWRPKHV